MKIGFVGLGKLGLPVALAVESKGHEVFGFDIKQEIYEQIKNRKIDYKEKHANDLLKKTKIKILDLKKLIKEKEYRISNGGDNWTSKGYLVPKEDLLDLI